MHECERRWFWHGARNESHLTEMTFWMGVVRWLLGHLEGAAVMLANACSPTKRLHRRYPSYDLLKAGRLAHRMQDGDRVLDIGCGNGHVLDELGLFRTLDRVGIDLRVGPRHTWPAGVELRPFDGRHVPFGDHEFDTTLLCYVLHHLSPARARELLSEAVRVTRRRLYLLEDSGERFSLLYDLRNALHRIGCDVEYASKAPAYQGPEGQHMFLTHDEWRRFLEDIDGIAAVTVESLADICKYDHHTLIELRLADDHDHGRSEEQ